MTTYQLKSRHGQVGTTRNKHFAQLVPLLVGQLLLDCARRFRALEPMQRFGGTSEHAVRRGDTTSTHASNRRTCTRASNESHVTLRQRPHTHPLRDKPVLPADGGGEATNCRTNIVGATREAHGTAEANIERNKLREERNIFVCSVEIDFFFFFHLRPLSLSSHSS